MVLVPNTEYPQAVVRNLGSTHMIIQTVPQKVKCHLSLCCSLLWRKDKTKMMKNWEEDRFAIRECSSSDHCALTEGECVGEQGTQNV